MKKNKSEAAAATANENIAAPPAPPGEQADIIDAPEVLRRVPISSGTLKNWRAAGKIPFILIGRRVLFSWESVRAALLRMERNGGAR